MTRHLKTLWRHLWSNQRPMPSTDDSELLEAVKWAATRNTSFLGSDLTSRHKEAIEEFLNRSYSTNRQ